MEDLTAGHCPQVPLDIIRGVLSSDRNASCTLAEEPEVTACQELHCDAKLLLDDTATIW